MEAKSSEYKKFRLTNIRLPYTTTDYFPGNTVAIAPVTSKIYRTVPIPANKQFEKADAVHIGVSKQMSVTNLR
jgi:hypothetical protein